MMNLQICRILFATLATLLIATGVFAQSPSKIKADDEFYREYMITVSRQLGVTCATCHNTKNWQDDKKNEFKVAKHHIKLVQLLIDNGMSGENGTPKADCYLCHRGKLKPDYVEPFHHMTMDKNKKSDKKNNKTEKIEDDEEDAIPQKK